MRQLFAYILILFVAALTCADDSELLNQEERLWLDSLNRPLVVAIVAMYHPYSFTDEHGNMDGVAGDYVRLLSDRLGFAYEVRSFSTFAELIAAAERYDVDIVPFVVAAPERKSYLNFTQPAYVSRDRIFMRKETQGTVTLSDLAGKRVGMVSGYAKELVLNRDLPEITVVPVPTELDGLRDLSLGRLDALISDLGTSSYYIQQEAITNLRVAGEVGGADLQTIASRKDWPLLNSILGKGLASITEEERAAIQARWVNYGGIDPRELERLWAKIATAASVLAFGLIVILAWSFSLKRQVAKNTRQLEREHAEKLALEADKLRLAVAVEQSAEFVLVVDNSARLEYANRSFLEACGLSNLYGRSVDSIVAPTSDTKLTRVLDHIGESGTWRGHIMIACKDEHPIKVIMTVAPIQNEFSEIDGYVATGRDVTRQEELESRLRRGEKLSALGTLAGGIAHDFNNLLMPISGYTEIMRKENLPSIEPYLDGIEEASDRARDLIRRIMVFGQEGTSEMNPIDLKAEIEESILFLRSLLPTTITLEHRLSDCGTIIGDRTQIQQILLNLCSNASDAMARDGGMLTISLCEQWIGANDDSGVEPGNYARLTVLDTGVGMGEKTKAKLFDPYFSDKQQASGTGLGLSIVHGIVVLHGGMIRVDSLPGEGAKFDIFLPVSKAQVSRSHEPPLHVTPGTSEARILVVDDDELVLNTVKSMLAGLGYAVSAWSDPHEALVSFEADPERYDAVLTDFTMPDMTGVQFANHVLEIRSDTPVSIMTGNSTAMENNKTLCISKPMQLSELADHMNTLLERAKPATSQQKVIREKETEVSPG